MPVCVSRRFSGGAQASAHFAGQGSGRTAPGCPLELAELPGVTDQDRHRLLRSAESAAFGGQDLFRSYGRPFVLGTGIEPDRAARVLESFAGRSFQSFAMMSPNVIAARMLLVTLEHVLARGRCNRLGMLGGRIQPEWSRLAAHNPPSGSRRPVRFLGSSGETGAAPGQSGLARASGNGELAGHLKIGGTAGASNPERACIEPSGSMLAAGNVVRTVGR